MLEGIAGIPGADARLVGRSWADIEVSGGRAQRDATGAHRDSVLVSVLFPSTAIGCAFQRGHAPPAPAVGSVASVDFRLLVHPAAAHGPGGLTLFADAAQGGELPPMTGSPDSLGARAGWVAGEPPVALLALQHRAAARHRGG